MKYLFVLGRNVDLSIAEVLCFFEKEGNPVLEYSINKNSMLLEVKEIIKKRTIDKLGGVVAIGEIISSGSIENIKKELKEKNLHFSTKNRLNYLIWNFSKDNLVHEISDFLKKKFREEKFKSTEKKAGSFITLQTGETVPNISSSLIDEKFFLFSGKEDYFGKIVEECNYKEISERDMKKPVRREELSISPRLSKIMINLSLVKEEEMLVDPFCGIGVILYEALIQEIKVIGIDNDKDAINGAKMNLEWGKFSKKDYVLFNENSKKMKILQSNVIVTEPALGQTLKKIPSKQEAEKMNGKFEELIISVINNLKGKIPGRIVFTAPLILVEKKRVHCNAEKITKRTNLKIAKGFPIEEFREGQIVGREIFVLER